HTIDYDTEQNEISTVAALSGQNDFGIKCIIHAYIIAHNISASPEHIYALLRDKSNILSSIVELNLDEITTILNNAHINHIIPEPSSIEATYIALTDTKTENEGETEIDDDTTIFDL